MKACIAVLLALPNLLCAENSPYVSELDVLAPYQTQMTVHGRDRKSIRFTTTFHNPFVQTWRRKDGKPLSSSDAALLSNRQPACPERCAPFVVDGVATGRMICSPARYQSTDVVVSADSVTFIYDCYDISGQILPPRSE